MSSRYSHFDLFPCKGRTGAIISHCDSLISVEYALRLFFIIIYLISSVFYIYLAIRTASKKKDDNENDNDKVWRFVGEGA